MDKKEGLEPLLGPSSFSGFICCGCQVSDRSLSVHEAALSPNPAATCEPFLLPSQWATETRALVKAEVTLVRSAPQQSTPCRTQTFINYMKTVVSSTETSLEICVSLKHLKKRAVKKENMKADTGCIVSHKS